MSPKWAYTFKVAVICCVCVADLAVNAVLDHKSSWPESYTPYALMGAQFVFQLCVARSNSAGTRESQRGGFSRASR
jgi:hypothetical protein